MYVPDELHDYFSDYPPMIGHYNVTDDMITPYTAKKKEALGINNCKCRKLMSDLLPKNGKLIHYLLFKQLVSLGVKVSKIHYVIVFKQSKWLSPFMHDVGEKEL